MDEGVGGWVCEIRFAAAADELAEAERSGRLAVQPMSTNGLNADVTNTPVPTYKNAANFDRRRQKNYLGTNY